jgi:hypothetical protein
MVDIFIFYSLRFLLFLNILLVPFFLGEYYLLLEISLLELELLDAATVDVFTQNAAAEMSLNENPKIRIIFYFENCETHQKTLRIRKIY